MRAVIQRVSEASVTAAGETLGAVGTGLVVLVAVGRNDTADDASYLVDKTVNLRIFPDADGRFDRSALDIGAALLVISQFTLYGDTRRGRRPSFIEAAPPEQAAAAYQEVVDRFRATGLEVATGRFQEKMAVSLVNDGPVTIWLDSADRHRPRNA